MLTMNSKKNATMYYGLIMATYSIGYVAMSAFSSVYLLDAGLTNGAIGMMLSIGSLVSVLLQPLVGSLIDNNIHVSSKRFLLLVGIVVAAIGGFIILTPTMSIGLKTFIYGIEIMLLMLAQPFLNSLGMDAINYGYPMNFGVGKTMGSFGYALGSFAFGRISVIAGPKSVPFVFSLAFLVFCVLLFIYPVKTEGIELKAVNAEGGSEDEDSDDLKAPFLVRYKRFAGLLIGLILIYFSHSIINTFALQIVTPKGGTSADMGTASSIAAVCEMITTFGFVYLMRKIRIKTLLRVSGIFFTLKILCSMLVPNIMLFYLIQSLQIFGWGLMAVGIVYYVNYYVGEHDKARGQAYAGMAYTIASVIATFIGGNIIDKFGISTLLLGGTILAAIGTIILWILIEDVGEPVAK